MTHYFSDISFAFSQSLGEKFSLITTGGHVSFQLLFFTPRFLYDSFVIPEPEPFSKTTLNIWKFTVHELLKPDWRILSITSLACEMSATVW